MIRILVIDEEPLIHEVVRATFEDDRYVVIGSRSAAAAMKELAGGIDVLLLHRGVPGGGCAALVEQARLLGDPGVLLLSSRRSQACEDDRRQLGAVEVLYKPLDPDVVRPAVAQVLARRQSTPEMPSGPRVLVVDDDPLVRGSVVDILGDHDYTVRGVESADEALELLEREAFDIVLTDVMMEGTTGLELVRRLPEVRPYSLAVVMTGYASKELAISALRHGAHDLLEKPLTPDLVLRAVERAWRMLRSELENQRLLRRLQASNQELLRAKDAAEAANRVKSEFLANMSHEVRTPLNGVLGCLELLEDSPLDADQQMQVATAQRSGETLLALLTDVLDFARLQAAELEPPTTPVDPRTLVRQVVEAARPRIEAAGLSLGLEVDTAVPQRIVAHGERLQRVIALLLDNARKFTGQGRVEVELTAVEGELRLTVTDSGPGIEPGEHERIFQPFYQTDGSITRSADGAGLGLALGRRLVEIQGGTLDVEQGAESSRGGSRFILRLPLAEA